MVPVGSPDNVRVETARVTVQGAFVRVVDPTDGSTVMDNTVLSATTIDPASGSTPGWSLVDVTMLDQAAIAHFNPGSLTAPSKVALAYVKVYGQTLGGQSVESNEFQFPIFVCNGCLVSFPPGAKESKYCSSATASTTGSSSSAVKAPCVIGSDQVADCTLCYPNPACDPANRP
jgi:hypothetical protein